jgi:hypothetical protein
MPDCGTNAPSSPPSSTVSLPPSRQVPRVPGEDELIARFVAGEIGDRPHALDHGLGPHRSHRGLRAGQAPPMQMVEDGLPRAFPLLPPGGGDDGNRKTKEGKDDD